ncbi:hypothetical protein ASPWEDRAFT_53028 [Aspergillus wentii DTO 134E9]|uniref:J domain-containing protein n=1 Tax=Aspergillus wentii DTO 134E9 TaxID=1073089 RepID=A0A1L9RDN2_ASPWE|nr:uncharacterized protein ASPWEDRAFT_53028 [Aspergillus wentii DTO 134E9]OJJ32963.1 hypothetical protein ASPWEDRAFT_53028 [Aspergillus wentii DTO 134E9]
MQRPSSPSPVGDDPRRDAAAEEPYPPPPDSSLDAEYSLILNYPQEDDYYALLSLPRDPAPTDADIRSAYRTLTRSFHPDKQPAHLRQVAEEYFARIQDAYETLIDPRKRVVYDLLGIEGVREEWNAGGVMGRGGEGRKDVGVRAKTPGEFRKWFLEAMKRRERGVVEGMVSSRGSITLGIDASSMITVDEEESEVYFHVPSLQPSSYAVSYTFNAPFPTSRLFLGDSVEEEDVEEGDEGGDKQTGKHGPYETETDMAIHASITGNIHQREQAVKLLLEDGTEEETKVRIPPILVANNLTLGASVNRVLGDVTSTKGILGLRPFRFLNNSVVSADALVLPAPAIKTSISKAIMLIPGTRPFRTTLNTTFSHSLFKCLPMIELQTSKQVGMKKHVFCNWNSGTIGWPLIIQQIFSPIVELGMDVESAFSVANQLSQFQIGFISYPQQPQYVTSLEEEDEEEEEENAEYRKMQTKSREINKAAESWQSHLAATPAGGSLSVVYARNIFSGTTANDSIRSEWSSEGHYPLPPEVEPRSVRLEVTTTITHDLSMAWNIEGVRRVSDFVRMGLGIGIDGGHGLVMTVSWSRLGQKIRLPITVCPLEVVNADAAALATIFPWLAYCAVEFGLIRPRDRKKRRQLIARKQRELKRWIPKKRAESLQAIALMEDQVQRRQAKEEAKNGLVITKAEYAYNPAAKKKIKVKDTSEYEVADVTIPVAALVDRSQLVIPRERVKFQILGFYDPAPLLPKKLKIWYMYHGREHFVEALDSEGITCPMRSHLLPH